MGVTGTDELSGMESSSSLKSPKSELNEDFWATLLIFRFLLVDERFLFWDDVACVGEGRNMGPGIERTSSSSSNKDCDSFPRTTSSEWHPLPSERLLTRCGVSGLVSVLLYRILRRTLGTAEN